MIDFAWVLYNGMQKLGFTEKEVGRMRFGKWSDLIEVYRKVYNFETRKSLFRIGEPEESSSLLSL